MKNVIKDASVLGLLAQNDKTFYVPVYQRNYSWRKEQIDILFDDVINQIDSRQKGHFFGSLYYFVESAGVFGNQNLVLIDGQQRLTTVMLFLIALRDLSENQTFRENVNKKYLLNESIQNQNKIKLKQAALDNIEYEKLISEDDAINTTHRIFDNYRRIKNHIKKFIESDYLENPQDGYEMILQGLNKLYLVLMELDIDTPAENPQVVFENINSIGLELTVNDLIRNYLLMGLEKAAQETLYQNYWVFIEQNIGDVDKNTPLFVRQFLHMKHKQYIKQDNKEIYRAYKKYFENQNISNEEALSELHKFSKYYSMIVETSEHSNRKVSDLLFEINSILKRTVSYCYILKLLSLNDEGVLDDENLVELLSMLISYLTRRTILNLGSGGSMDELFINLTRFITDMDNFNNIVDVIYDYLSRRVNTQRFPSDSELKDELKKRDFYSLTLRYYVLEKVSNEITGRNAPINFRDHADIQYEHIMPQSLTRDQGDGYIAGDSYDKFFTARINSLSNATLTDINQELGNLPFEDKKRKLENDSNLLISRKWITNKECWDIEAMDARFEEIFQFIVKAFPYPEKYQVRASSILQEAEYSLDDLLQEEIDISSFQIIGMIFNGESFEYSNNATKLYTDFFETISDIDGINLDQLCENPTYRRRTGEFNFSRNRSSVYRPETASVKELENGIFVDTCYNRNDLFKKMLDVLEYFDCDKRIIIKVRG